MLFNQDSIMEICNRVSIKQHLKNPPSFINHFLNLVYRIEQHLKNLFGSLHVLL